MKDPTLSDIDFKHEMSLVWTTLKIFIILVFLVQFGAYEFHHFLQNHFHCIWLYLRAAWLQVKQKQLLKNDNATSLVQGLLKDAFISRFKWTLADKHITSLLPIRLFRIQRRELSITDCVRFRWFKSRIVYQPRIRRFDLFQRLPIRHCSKLINVEKWNDLGPNHP